MRNRWTIAVALLLCVVTIAACARLLSRTPSLPTVADADAVGAETCLACHLDITDLFANRAHRTMADHRDNACEACHGPGSRHVETLSADEIVNRATLSGLSPAQRSQMCLTCHDRGVGSFWHSEHADAGVSCWSCHPDALHGVRESTARNAAGNLETWWYYEPAQLDRGRVTSFAAPQPGSRRAEFCYQCHADVKSDFELQFHHPVPEGRIRCTDCHSPHGEATIGFADEGAERCLSCHREIGGPWLFEHLALEDGCLPCHRAHGSTVEKLLWQADNGMCEQCHFDARYPLIGGVEHTGFLSGGALCVDCHFQVHGSNTDESLNPLRGQEIR